MKTNKPDNKNLEYTGIPRRIFQDIHTIAAEYHVARILLFGSRARGMHQSKSDLDLAVYGCKDFTKFCYAIEEHVWTLLKIDLINMDETVSKELISEIERDGIVIYEKV